MGEDDFNHSAIKFCEKYGIEDESELGQLLGDAISGTFYAIMNPAIAERFCFGSKADFDSDIEDLKESFPGQEVQKALEATMGGRNVFDQDYCIVPASNRLAYEALDNHSEAKEAVPYQALKEHL